MIALGTDADIYNEALYGGGTFGEGFWNWWWKAFTGNNSRGGARRETDWMARVRATPFNDPAAYGPKGSIFMIPERHKATAPLWIVGPQTGVTLHQLGSSETFIHSTGVKAKKFDFVDAWFPHSYKDTTVAEHMAFFDHWFEGGRQRRDGRPAGSRPAPDRQRLLPGSGRCGMAAGRDPVPTLVSGRHALGLAGRRPPERPDADFARRRRPSPAARPMTPIST